MRFKKINQERSLVNCLRFTEDLFLLGDSVIGSTLVSDTRDMSSNLVLSAKYDPFVQWIRQ